jgi:hypothetical protein
MSLLHTILTLMILTPVPKSAFLVDNRAMQSPSFAIPAMTIACRA